MKSTIRKAEKSIPKKEWSSGRSKSSKLALHGMGTLFRRGTRGMNELVVAHIEEGSNEDQVRWFLRTLHRSGMTARADVVIVFPWSPIPPQISRAIEEENRTFMKLFNSLVREASAQQTMPKTSVNISHVGKSEQLLSSSRIVVNKGGGEFNVARAVSTCKISRFNSGAFKKAAQDRNYGVGDGKANEPLWGSHNGNQSTESEVMYFEPVWGSIVGFDVSELNPDDALIGFLDQPPIQLRRWACYQMLLGKVRHKFKHVLLTEVKGVLVLGDAMAVVRKKNGLYLTVQDRTWSDLMLENGTWSDPIPENGKDIGLNSKGSNGVRMQGIFESVYGNQLWTSLDKREKEMKLVNSGVILGGIQPVRRLANAMMTEIVRVALQRKSRNPFPDSVLLTYLIQKSYVLGKKVMENVHTVENSDSIVHSLEQTKQKDLFFRKKASPYIILQGYVNLVGRANITAMLLDDICSSQADAVAYEDCVLAYARYPKNR